MIQTQILTSASPAHSQKSSEGFQVHKANTARAGSRQQQASSFRGFNRPEKSKDARHTHSTGMTANETTRTQQAGTPDALAHAQTGEQAVNRFQTENNAVAGRFVNNKQANDKQADERPETQDTLTGVVAALNEFVSLRQQQDSRSHEHSASLQTGLRTGNQVSAADPGIMQNKQEQLAASGKSGSIPLQDNQQAIPVALNQAEKTSLKSVLLTNTADLQSAGPAQPVSASVQVTPHTQGTTGTAGTVTPNSAEWAAMRVDSQSGKWGEQMLSVLHDRVTLQAQQHLQEARIRLDPPELGKLDLFVRVDGDRLNVQIHASSTVTRDALMQVSDRLRAELQQQNFVHVDVNVGSQQQDSHPSYTSSEDEPTIFASRSEHRPDEHHSSVASEHWLNTQA